MKVSYLLLIICSLSSLSSTLVNYDGYTVFRLWPENEKQRSALKKIEEDSEVDFWSALSMRNFAVDIMVKPDYQPEFFRRITEVGLNFSVYISNVANALTNTRNSPNLSGMTWNAYHKLEDIYSWFQKLANRYPFNVTVLTAGSTFENRHIEGVKISFGPGRNAVFLEGGLHAREWISPATLTFIINELLASKDKQFRRIAESFDWYIFPVTNPDGYVFTHTKNRCWRKTRTFYKPTCRGADANRNWNSHWGEFGCSKLCSSSTYRGTKAFSEKCTRSLSKYIRKLGPKLVAYLAFHSYSQRLMVPYGYTAKHMDNYNDTIAISKVAVRALASRYGTTYTTGNVAETIYRASGGSIDWVKQEFQTPLVFVYEMRDRGSFGFLLPPTQIIPNCEEIIDSLVALFNEANKLGIVSLI